MTMKKRVLGPQGSRGYLAHLSLEQFSTGVDPVMTSDWDEPTEMYHPAYGEMELPSDGDAMAEAALQHAQDSFLADGGKDGPIQAARAGRTAYLRQDNWGKGYMIRLGGTRQDRAADYNRMQWGMD